jgi:hypothetical protein
LKDTGGKARKKRTTKNAKTRRLDNTKMNLREKGWWWVR